MDDCLQPFQVVFGGDKADGGMEAGGVVVFDEVADDVLEWGQPLEVSIFI